jgi:hypothetical protein
MCHRFLGEFDLRQGEVVNEKMLRGDLQVGQGQAHRLPGGWDDPLGINLPRSYCSYAHRLGCVLDNAEKLLSATGREELGVSDRAQFHGENDLGYLSPEEG